MARYRFHCTNGSECVFDAQGVEAQHPVTHDLEGDAPDPGSVRSRAAVVDLSKRQKTTGLGGVLGRLGEPAQSRTVEVPAQRNRHSHGETPWFATASQTSIYAATPKSLTSRPLV